MDDFLVRPSRTFADAAAWTARRGRQLTVWNCRGLVADQSFRLLQKPWKWSRQLAGYNCRYSSTQLCDDYDAIYQRSISNPAGFWGHEAAKLTWYRKWDQVLDLSNPPFTKWFPGGRINVCYNAIDRHVDNGQGERVAIVHDSPVTRTIRKITYRELHAEVCKMAAGLRALGVHRGDTVLIYMPMMPEAIITMLACARLGAIHSLVFGGFAARELAVRIRHCQPKVIVTANCGIEPGRIVKYQPVIEEALKLSALQSPKCIVFQRPQFEKSSLVPKRDVSWEELQSLGSGSKVDCEPVDSQHPLYILYTSGTTGDPKGVVRPSADHAVMLHWTMDKVYGTEDGDTWWAASDLGWVVGHSYICYGPLLRGLTTVLYEGKPVGTPDAGAFFRVISEHGIQGMFTAPTALRAIRKEDPNGKFAKKYDLSKLRCMFLAGEHCDVDTMDWATKVFGVPILDNWWQTESGSPMTCVCAGLTRDLKAPKNSSGKPIPGWKFRVIKDDGTFAQPEEMGRIVAEQPLPPGFMSTLYKNDEKFIDLYFSKYSGMYDTMDAGIIDRDGFVYVMARDDDIINVAGHRISTKAIEEALLDHPDLIECAVIGVPDTLKGEIPVGLYVLNKVTNKPDREIELELVQTVRRLVGPVAAFKTAIRINALPKTRSGKIARKSIADLAKNKAVKIPGTIEDSTVYIDIKAALQRHGFATEAPDPFH